MPYYESVIQLCGKFDKTKLDCTLRILSSDSMGATHHFLEVYVKKAIEKLEIEGQKITPYNIALQLEKEGYHSVSVLTGEFTNAPYCIDGKWKLLRSGDSL